MTNGSGVAAASTKPPVGSLSVRKIAGMVLALAALIAFQSIRFAPSLTTVGHALLSVLIFMLILWVTEAVGYAASSFFLVVGITVLVGFSRAPEAGGKLVGTGKALTMALAGFSSGAWILVVSALFLASAIEMSGLGQRIGLFILSRMGAKPRQVRLGVLVMSFILTLFIPAQAANAALMTAVCVGLIEAFKIDRKDNLAKGMLLLVAFGTGISGMGILTSGAPPIQTQAFINQATRHSITWLQWASYGVPFSLVVGAVLFLLIEFMFPVKNKELSGGKQLIRQELAKCGPLSARERKLLVIMSLTIIFWATGNILHPLDSSTVALLAVVAMFFPGIGVTNWKEMNSKVNWGTIMLFGAAISLGQALLSSGAAAWVAKSTLISMGVDKWPVLILIGAAGLFFAIFSLAFSARTAAVAALVPTAIGFAQGMPNSGLSVWGLTLILYYTIQFSVIIPVNTPMSMVAYTTDTFNSKEMMRVGIPLVIIAVILMMLFSATYWRWVGVL
ncbi:MAG: DASS family sodium-coupled anion symporter [Candidatus Korobacteraceae bacterium]|jgi:anion transporter